MRCIVHDLLHLWDFIAKLLELAAAALHLSHVLLYELERLDFRILRPLYRPCNKYCYAACLLENMHTSTLVLISSLCMEFSFFYESSLVDNVEELSQDIAWHYIQNWMCWYFCTLRLGRLDWRGLYWCSSFSLDGQISIGQPWDSFAHCKTCWATSPSWKAARMDPQFHFLQQFL